MTRRAQASLWLLGGILCWLSLAGPVRAATISVNCNAKPGQQHTIGGGLKQLDPSGPNTIDVSGSCNENVLIQGFNRLTLNAVNGASITDASGGAGIVVDIEDSTDVTLQGLTINGGDIGVFCGDLSVCRFKNNIIQGANDTNVNGDGWGVAIGSSRATFDGDILQNNANRGLNVGNASSARSLGIQVNHNGNVGIQIGGGSVFMGDPATVENNGGPGVRVTAHSTFTLFGGTITGNTGSGVRVDAASEATIQSFDAPIAISGNGSNGVRIEDLSFAVFTNSNPPLLNVTGNAALDVNCVQIPFSARGATTDINGGSTNCIKPN